MTTRPDVHLPNGTSARTAPYVECAHADCEAFHEIRQAFRMTPDQVYGSLREAGWSTDPARCPQHLPGTYELMSEDDRRAAINYLLEQGRHIEDLPQSWTTEDAFQTIESLMEAYQGFIAPHEMGDITCRCGNSRHPVTEA